MVTKSYKEYVNDKKNLKYFIVSVVKCLNNN